MGIVGVQPPQVAGLLASAVNRGQGIWNLVISMNRLISMNYGVFRRISMQDADQDSAAEAD